MNVLKILYPDRCPLCDGARPIKETGFCPECIKKLNIIKEPVCKVCGRPVTMHESVCDECKVKHHYFDGGRALLAYSGINESIYRFKYMNRAAYASGYAKLMNRYLGDWLKSVKPDAFIPVPLHKKRLIGRGYNQSTQLALELSKLTGIPVRATAADRIKNTRPLKLMGAKDREINMKKAFIVKENVVNLKRVVIIDDIFTTGSTIDSLSFELKKAGVREIFFLTVSRAGI